MAQEKSSSIRQWVLRGSVLLLIVVFFVVRSMTRDTLQVKATQVERTDLINTVSTNGHVEPETNYEIHSPLATSIKAVYVQPGDQVPAGKLLLALDDMDAKAKVATAESGVKAAQAAVEAATHNGTRQERQMASADESRARLEYEQAKRDLDTLTKLHATGAASASEVAAARQREASAEASLKAAEDSAHNRYSAAEVARAKAELTEAQANLAAAHKILEQTAVRAPAAGTIYNLGVARTEYSEEGKLLLQMADLRREQVRAYFDEPEIGRLAVGQKIQIKWDAKPNRVWNGHIIRIPITVITYGTRNVGEVLVAIDDADGQLLPDTNVTVTVTTSSEHNSLTVPREALHSEGGKTFVYKIVKDGLQKTTVSTGTINLTQVAILSGLKEGDQVATGTTSGQSLQEGVPIKVVR
jgi:HlyD family secretion protein